MSTTRLIHIKLAISSEELMKLYRGQAKDVVARSIDGLTIRFPALALQPFVSRDGVHGMFSIEIDQHNRLINIVRKGASEFNGLRDE